MKKILITGLNSYVGTSLKRWLASYPNRYSVESISLRNDSWKDRDFSEYDVVVHVAGIAHIKETKENAGLYYRVNCDLANEVAMEAKNKGVGQFIFLSSMSVYGMETGIIKKDTPLKPKSNYGKSKLRAEELISILADNTFKVAILRPPMIYGKGCKGNYTRLASFALKTPVFPDIKNKRSMLYIDNLTEFIKLLIDDCSSGLFFPENNEYVNTSEMVKSIAEVHGKKIKMIKLFNPLLKLLKIGMVNKVFGDLVYEKDMSKCNLSYSVCDFESSIPLTERGR